MIKKAFSVVSVRAPLALALVVIVSGLGCAKNSADLRLTCLESNNAFTQQFPKAYISKGAEGNTEIVLVNDTPTATGSADVRQVMHVKVLWRPQKGTKQGHPSYTNAALHWYVIDGADVLEYTGAGFVAMGDAIGGTKVTIRNATVKPTASFKGSLSDPIGAASLKGSFVAKKSAKRVNDLLAEVRNAAGNAPAQQASAR
jgi:hypothetical protein